MRHARILESYLYSITGQRMRFIVDHEQIALDSILSFFDWCDTDPLSRRSIQESELLRVLKCIGRRKLLNEIRRVRGVERTMDQYKEQLEFAHRIVCFECVTSTRETVDSLRSLLSSKQRQVLDCRLSGYRNGEISQILGLSEKTVSRIRKTITVIAMNEKLVSRP